MALPIQSRNLQSLATDPYALQMLEDFLGHPLWQLHSAVIVKYLDAADIFAFYLCLVGNRAHYISGLYTVLKSDFDTKALHPCIRATACRLTASLTAWQHC